MCLFTTLIAFRQLRIGLARHEVCDLRLGVGGAEGHGLERHRCERCAQGIEILPTCDGGGVGSALEG